MTLTMRPLRMVSTSKERIDSSYWAGSGVPAGPMTSSTFSSTSASARSYLLTTCSDFDGFIPIPFPTPARGDPPARRAARLSADGARAPSRSRHAAPSPAGERRPPSPGPAPGAARPVRPGGPGCGGGCPPPRPGPPTPRRTPPAARRRPSRVRAAAASGRAARPRRRPAPAPAPRHPGPPGQEADAPPQLADRPVPGPRPLGEERQDLAALHRLDDPAQLVLPGPVPVHGDGLPVGDEPPEGGVVPQGPARHVAHGPRARAAEHDDVEERLVVGGEDHAPPPGDAGRARHLPAPDQRPRHARER